MPYFRAEEFLPPDLYNKYGPVGVTALIDSRILWTMNALREHFNAAITVNNYHVGGHLMQRGFRNDPGIGAPLSQHRFGRACDFDIAGVTAESFRQLALAGKLNEQLQFITRIENSVAWCHIDCMGEKILGKIHFFNA